MIVRKVYRQMEELEDVPGDRTVYLVKRYESSDGFPHRTALVIDTATFDEETAERRVKELYRNRGPGDLAFHNVDTDMEEVRNRTDFTLADIETITDCLVEERETEATTR